MVEIQEKTAAQRYILRVFTAVIFAAAFAFYALIIFGLLPPVQDTKYTRAAENYGTARISQEDLFDLRPLYLQIHVNAARLFGRSSIAVQWLHILLIAFSICIFFRLLLRFFPLWLAVTGSIVLLMQRSLIVSTQAMEPESIIVFFLLAFFHFVGGSSRKACLLSGACLGITAIIRPDFAFLIVFIPLYFLLTIPDRRAALSSALLCAAPAIIGFALVWVRQALMVGYFSWWILGSGISIYEGNNAVSSGLSSVYPPIVEETSALNPGGIDSQQKTYRRFARSITGLQLTSTEVNRYWSLKAIHFLQDNPRHAMNLLSNKLFHFFHEYQWHELPVTFWNETQLRDSGIPSVPFCLFSALTLAGLWFGGKRWKEWILIYAALLGQFLFIMAIYLSARYRTPLTPLFVFFGLAAVHSFVTRWKTLFWLILVLPATWIFHAKTDKMFEETRLWQSIRAFNQLSNDSYQKRAAHQWIEASESASKSLAAAPFFLDSRRPSSLPFENTQFFISGLALVPANTSPALFDRGFLSLQAKLPGQAEIAMREVLKSGWHFKRDQYQSSEPLYYLGRASWMRRNKKEAETRFREAWKKSPGDPWNLAALYTVTRHDSFRSKLFQYFDDIDAHFFLGEAALELGFPGDAVTNFSYVAHQIPESRKIRIFLASALANASRLDEAEGIYRLALQMSPDPAMRENEILNLFRRLSERSPEDPEKLYMYGFILRQFGHYQDALVVQHQALEKSQAPAIRAEIAALQNVLSKLAASD